MNIIDKPTTHFSDRLGRRVEYIIVHSSESPVGDTPEGTATYLVKNARKVSSHEVVGPGVAYRLLSDERAAHHAGSETSRLPNGWSGQEVNLRTYGIEAFQILRQPVDAATRATLLVRVVDACRRLHLPASCVLAHRETDPLRRQDPRGIDMQEFRAQVADALGAEAVLDLKQLSNDLRWNAEQTMRDIQAGNTTVALARLDREVVPRAYALERHHKGK